MARITIEQIKQKKERGCKVTMLTAYDFSLACLLDQCAIDMILVGDSLANVVLGLESTREVDMDIMLHHAKAVNRGVQKALVVGDMPFSAYQEDMEVSVTNASRFVEEGGCDAVKVEWFDRGIEVVTRIIRQGIPVMGHIGLTPQTVEQLGGFKVQGRDADRAIELLRQAVLLEEAGCFSIVLECVPVRIAEIITKKVKIPTIGIGAGPLCDGQVLVTPDMLGLFDRYKPKFVKKYVDVAQLIKTGVEDYSKDVCQSTFPDSDHSYHMTDDEFEKFKKAMGA